MRRYVVLLALALTLGSGAWAELELGLGIAPPIGEVPKEAKSDDFFGDATKVAHVGYSFWWLFYASYDGFILPPYAVSQLTGTIDVESNGWKPGYFRPGFLNTINVGFRPTLGPLILSTTVGINTLYVYRQLDDELDTPPLGVNLRLGVGLKLAKFLGITLSGTSVFGDPRELVSTLQALGSSNEFTQQLAIERILSNLFPSAVISLHL